MSDSLTAQQLAELVGSSDTPHHPALALTRVAAPGSATPDSLVFAEDADSLERALASAAGIILAPETEPSNARLLRVASPRFAFALAARALTPKPAGPLRHPSAVIDPNAQLAATVNVAAGAIIEADCILGEHTSIGAGAKILRGTTLGARVVVQAGAVLGGTGFGYVRHPRTGEYILFPQQGTLLVEDDVEIGANSTIDRGALGETRIGRGTKLDNLVHIGHNCRIGANVVIAAQVGISGSCTVEDGAILAGQVGISDHCHIGPGVILGGQAGVFRGKSVTGPGEMFAGTPAEPIKDYLKGLAKIRRL